MARITLTTPISDIAGSVGGLTFQNNSSGLIVRRRPTGKKAITKKQSAILSKLQQLRHEWAALILTDQTLWNDYAALYTKENLFGQVKSLTGFNWFVSINANLLTANRATVKQPTARIIPAAVAPYELICEATTLDIKFSAPFDPGHAVLVVWASSNLTTSSNSLQRELRQIAVFEAAPYSQFHIINEWQTYYGTPFPLGGSKGRFKISVALQTIEFDSGLASVGLIESADYKP